MPCEAKAVVSPKRTRSQKSKDVTEKRIPAGTDMRFIFLKDGNFQLKINDSCGISAACHTATPDSVPRNAPQRTSDGKWT